MLSNIQDLPKSDSPVIKLILLKSLSSKCLTFITFNCERLNHENLRCEILLRK